MKVPTPVHPPVPDRAAVLELEREANAWDARIAAVARRTRRCNAELAELLSGFEERSYHRALSCEDIGRYAEERGYASARDAQDLVRLVRQLETRPLMQAAFRAGDVAWTKLRTVAPHAKTPADEARLLEQARRLSNRKLELLVAGERGEAPLEAFGFKGSPEDKAWVERAIEVFRKASGGTLDRTQALARVCRAALEQHATVASGSGPTNRIVLNTCDGCKTTTLETREGPVPVSTATLEQACCDAERLDVRPGVTRITKTIPPAVRRHVFERDKERCQVPGCKNRGWLHVHHEPGRALVGHDPEFMTLLCTVHHPDRHEGRLVIRGSYTPGFRFFLASGAEVTADGLVEPAKVVSPASADAESARRALKSLGCAAREAATLVESALSSLGSRAAEATLEELIREALRWMPTPGARSSG